MKFFHRRLLRSASILAILSIFILILHRICSFSLIHSNFRSGWLLLLVIIFLAAFNIRKKLTVIPLIKASTWLQLHIYAGLLTITIFLCHIDFGFPNGFLEITLTLLFAAVTVSGIFGLFISRLFSKRLTTRGEEVIFERIPILQRNIRDQLDYLVSNSISETDSTSIANFYANHLKEFFDKPKNLFHHLFESRRPLHSLLNEIEAQDRYLSEKEKETIQEIISLIRSKDNLDYHYSHQVVLKVWMFVHIPLTYSLIMVSIVHVILVYAFHGSIR